MNKTNITRHKPAHPIITYVNPYATATPATTDTDRTTAANMLALAAHYGVDLYDIAAAAAVTAIKSAYTLQNGGNRRDKEGDFAVSSKNDDGRDTYTRARAVNPLTALYRTAMGYAMDTRPAADKIALYGDVGDYTAAAYDAILTDTRATAEIADIPPQDMTAAAVAAIARKYGMRGAGRYLQTQYPQRRDAGAPQERIFIRSFDDISDIIAAIDRGDTTAPRPHISTLYERRAITPRDIIKAAYCMHIIDRATDRERAIIIDTIIRGGVSYAELATVHPELFKSENSVKCAARRMRERLGGEILSGAHYIADITAGEITADIWADAVRYFELFATDDNGAKCDFYGYDIAADTAAAIAAIG